MENLITRYRNLTVLAALLFAQVLRQTHGHQSRASEVLGLNRTTLRHKLRALGMAVDKVLVEDGTGEE